MKFRFPILFILLFSTSVALFAQTYVGEVLYRDAYEYVKLNHDDNGYSFNLPYVDGDVVYKTETPDGGSSAFSVLRNGQRWTFDLEQAENNLKGKVFNNHGIQEVILHKQIDPIEPSAQIHYVGVYRDSYGRRVIIYKDNGYLHLMSPFSEQTMSLKPIGKDRFWSISGAYWNFTDSKNNSYQTLTRVDRFGKTYMLQKIAGYEVEELWIPVNGDTLYSRLYLPKTNVKVPGCLLLPGGGSLGIDNYEYEARFFAGYGMACLVFDKSGVGKSKGSGNFQVQSFEEKNEQYKQLFKYLQNHPRIISSKVGVHGPSEGGRLALMMAMDLKEVAFVNATAAPIMSFREGQLYAMDHYHRNLGIKEQDILSVRTVWDAYYNGIETGSIDQNTIDKANALRGLHQRMFLPPNTTRLPLSPNKEDLENDRMMSEIAKISCPVFLQYGANDTRVDPYKSATNFYNQKNDQIKSRTLFYKRGNHSFMTPEFEICTGYLDDKIAWLNEISIIKL